MRSVSWLRALVFAGLLLGPCSNLFPATAFGPFSPQVALAHHSAAGGVGPGECGDASLRSGRPHDQGPDRWDGRHRVLLPRLPELSTRNLVGSSFSESYGYPARRRTASISGGRTWSIRSGIISTPRSTPKT
jgi:hypothetical protein